MSENLWFPDVFRGYRNGTLGLYELTVMFQPAFTCSKLTIKTLEQGVKYVQS